MCVWFVNIKCVEKVIGLKGEFETNVFLFRFELFVEMTCGKIVKWNEFAKWKWKQNYAERKYKEKDEKKQNKQTKK